ncbi:hypothetical protein [Hazenella coriacea]|uniref:Uncharacterized protein n=1 Tax=Hazenella coriacea TaxID=1179467 RepID=A0A4R3L7Y6_9BACL|nr:hypothetical protein [Hazenella coriacea]TCS95662.1 hypothetical protein EDD58_102238 [Hazenella coriacea]
MNKQLNSETEAREKKKSKRLVGLFAASMLVVPLTGCDDEVDLEDLCFDDDFDKYCDDDGSTYDSNNYVVLNGKRFAYLKDNSSLVSDSSNYKKGLGSGSSSGG